MLGALNIMQSDDGVCDQTTNWPSDVLAPNMGLVIYNLLVCAYTADWVGTKMKSLDKFVQFEELTR